MESSVCDVVWQWRKRPKERDAAARDEGRPGRRALIEAAVASAVGLALLLLLRRPVISAIAFFMAALILAGGYFFPPLYRAIGKGGSALAKAAGIALSWILLVPFFYICFTAGRLALIVARKDPLARKFPTAEPTYWVGHKPITGPEHYSRQYRIEV